MEKYIKLFDELTELGREWLELVRGDRQEGHTDYADGYVRCYFASNSDHTAFYVDKFEIAYHRIPSTRFDINRLPFLEEAIERGRKLLVEEIERRSLRIEEEKTRLRNATRAELQRKLVELDQEIAV